MNFIYYDELKTRVESARGDGQRANVQYAPPGGVPTFVEEVMTNLDGHAVGRLVGRREVVVLMRENSGVVEVALPDGTDTQFSP